MSQTVHSEARVWQDALHNFLLDYRLTPHVSTNKTPALLMFGREIRTEIPVFNSEDWKSKQTMEELF